MGHKKRLLVILSAITLASALLTVVTEYFYRDRFNTRVYSATHYIEVIHGVEPSIHINTSGMPVEVSVWDGDTIRIRTVAELPLFITEEIDEGYSHNLWIAQDDGFAISFFTLAMFSYNLQICLPRSFRYTELNIGTSGGDVTLNAYHLRTADGVQIDTNNANVSVVRGMNNYRIRTVSGNVFMDLDFVVASVVINSYSGNIEVRIPETIPQRARDLMFVRSKYGMAEIVDKDMTLPENVPLL
jgi:hypothetical protein